MSPKCQQNNVTKIFPIWAPPNQNFWLLQWSGLMLCTHRRRQGRGSCPPWIFKHGTNIVDRGLKVLFFDLFCYFSVFFRCLPPSWKNFCRRPCLHYPCTAECQAEMRWISIIEGINDYWYSLNILLSTGNHSKYPWHGSKMQKCPVRAT